MQLSDQHPFVAHATKDSHLIRAFVGHRPAITPVWFMRQAGRSLPEYRALREGSSMLDACLSAEKAVAAETFAEYDKAITKIDQLCTQCHMGRR